MLLQRCTRLLPLAILAIAAGCAGSGTAPDKSQAAGPRAPVIGEDGEIIRPEIPAGAMTMFEQAAAVMAAGDFLDAELRFKEFLLQYPDFPGAHVNLAIIHSSNGNDDAAMQAVNAALAVDPGHAAALNQKGMLLRKNGKFLEAEAAYLKAVTAQPDYALAHYNLGVLNELYLQRLDVALQHFELYQELVGNDKQVEKWIADLTRRVAASQRTANVAD
jgi:tetratricopeptide (TPR) repeat protein